MTEREQQPEGEIIISGLDNGPDGQQGVPADDSAAPTGNVSPTDKAIQRQLEQKPRGEPEDEDG